MINDAFVFDCVDGQLARYTRQFSTLGAWLDATFDRAKEYTVFAGLAVGSTAAVVVSGAAACAAGSAAAAMPVGGKPGTLLLGGASEAMPSAIRPPTTKPPARICLRRRARS